MIKNIAFGNCRTLTPCQNMWVAVLKQAIDDKDLPFFKTSRSFEKICIALHLNTEYTRKKAIEAIRCGK